MGELSKKYDFREKEEYWRKYWEEEEIYKFDETLQSLIYSVDTPPPYVSAEHLHIGHIMSYSQAEFIVRYKRMRGFNVYYPMGFDDNGLPTERYVEKKYNIDKSKVARSDFIKLCLKETKAGAKNYYDLWRLMGISVDWSKTYSTINSHSQKISQWSFIDLYKKGKAYQTVRPALYCTTCKTAISQADLEAEERDSKLFYIKVLTKKGQELTFATTRPELLPACMGISVNPEDNRFKKLIGKNVVLPITKQEVLISAEESVNPEFGTGVVYYCSFGGSADIEWLAKHPEAKPKNIINKEGLFSEEAGEYAGLSPKAARKKLVEDLKKIGAIQKEESIKNVTYIHERCGTDIEYISTEQWFIDVLNVKDELLKKGDKINWHPESMKSIYDSWVLGLKWDWCISRQRYYGVPFPVWYCLQCKEVMLPEAEDLPVDPTNDLPKKVCQKCGGKDFRGESDVMDTWMTSSLSPKIGRELIDNKSLWPKLTPESLRPQAFEIIRTWLFYTIVKSYYHENDIPFKNAMISGHGLDEKGRKISKRLGNYVIPSIIIEQFGADALRYWATGVSLGANIRWNEEEVKKGKKTVTKLSNVAKFVLERSAGVDITKEIKFKDEDKWFLGKLNLAIKEATDAFDGYEYQKARNAIDETFWLFTDYYLEFVKYRVYGDDENSKRAAVKTLLMSLLAIIKLYAPVLPFITEEIYQAGFREKEGKKSIHISEWPKPKDDWHQTKKELADFGRILNLVDEIRAHKTKLGISIGKEIDEYKTTVKLTRNQCQFLEATQKVEKVISG